MTMTDTSKASTVAVPSGDTVTIQPVRQPRSAVILRWLGIVALVQAILLMTAAMVAAGLIGSAVVHVADSLGKPAASAPVTSTDTTAPDATTAPGAPHVPDSGPGSVYCTGLTEAGTPHAQMPVECGGPAAK